MATAVLVGARSGVQWRPLRTQLRLPEQLVQTRIAVVFRSTSYHGRISSSRLIRREWSSLLPAHSAVASACLVSKLPSEVQSSIEGQFSNYVNPI